MNKNMVVRILGKKAHHFTAISMTIMLVSLISTGFLFSYLIHQYMSINRDFFENQNVKVIHISGRSEQDYFKTLELKDVQEINALINDNGLGEFAQAYPIYVLPTIFNQETGEGLSTTAIDEAIAFLISDYCMLNDQTICLPEADSDSMMIGVPIIEEQEGGYSSNEIVSLSYKTEQGATRENAVIIQNAPQVNQTYVNEKTALDLLELMYGSSQNSFEYILETHLDKIIVYVNSVKDVDQIGELLTSNNYYSSYTFNSFEHFSTNITNLQIVLIILSIVFILIAIMTSVLLVINFIRIQKKRYLF